MAKFEHNGKIFIHKLFLNVIYRVLVNFCVGPIYFIHLIGVVVTFKYVMAHVKFLDLRLIDIVYFSDFE